MSLSEYVKKEDLVRLFHLPMKEASKRLGVSESSLRNICRYVVGVFYFLQKFF